MSIQTFEDVLAWQKAKELYLGLYTELARSKEGIYKDELLRATLSISNSIAEGFDRGSKKEFHQCVILARGAAAEVRSMLYIGLELRMLPVEKVPQYLTLSKEISRLLSGLARSLQSAPLKTDARKQTTPHDLRS